MKILYFLALALGLGATLATAGEKTIPFGVESIRTQVDGLSCPFCAYNVEKRVTTLSGFDHLAALNVSVDDGSASFGWNPAISFDPEAANEQIRLAGFTPGDIDLTATGLVTLVAPLQTGQEGALLLKFPNLNQTIPLIPDKARYQGVYSRLSHEVVLHDPGSGFPARIHGRVKPEGRVWTLILQNWEPLVNAKSDS